jgi:catechol 2,3-dioxygenase-like lactoylglutathione lyase family enzyme
MLRGTSHFAIGVRDLERSLAFYRDLLGFRVSRDRHMSIGVPALLSDPARTEHREVHLRWSDDPDAAFLELSEAEVPAGEAIHVDQVGIHHLAFWVDDVPGLHARLVEAGVEVLTDVAESSHRGAPGEPFAGTVRTFLVKDPDGVILQFEEWV